MAPTMRVRTDRGPVGLARLNLPLREWVQQNSHEWGWIISRNGSDIVIHWWSPDRPKNGRWWVHSGAEVIPRRTASRSGSHVTGIRGLAGAGDAGLP